VSKIRALITEDSDIFAQRIFAMLARVNGIEVVRRARNVPEAVEAVRNLRPDLVILDIGMPGGSGFDVLEGMKRAHETAIVIVLTNYSYSHYRKKCLQLGARFFFDKTELEHVADVLRELVCDSSQLSTPGGLMSAAPPGAEAAQFTAGDQIQVPQVRRREKQHEPGK
jgi:DNA-binding NarL/FixJ family response regulator